MEWALFLQPQSLHGALIAQVLVVRMLEYGSFLLTETTRYCMCSSCTTGKMKIMKLAHNYSVSPQKTLTFLFFK